MRASNRPSGPDPSMLRGALHRYKRACRPLEATERSDAGLAVPPEEIPAHPLRWGFLQKAVAPPLSPHPRLFGTPPARGAHRSVDAIAPSKGRRAVGPWKRQSASFHKNGSSLISALVLGFFLGKEIGCMTLLIYMRFSIVQVSTSIIFALGGWRSPLLAPPLSHRRCPSFSPPRHRPNPDPRTAFSPLRPSTNNHQHSTNSPETPFP